MYPLGYSQEFLPRSVAQKELRTPPDSTCNGFAQRCRPDHWYCIALISHIIQCSTLKSAGANSGLGYLTAKLLAESPNNYHHYCHSALHRESQQCRLVSPRVLQPKRRLLGPRAGHQQRRFDSRSGGIHQIRTWPP